VFCVLTGIVCYIGIGSNLGNPVQNCQDAIEKVSRIYGVQLIKASSFYLTEPVDINPDKHQNWFINAVAEVKANLSASDLLSKLQGIETAMGRTRQTKGEPRIVDLDLLFYGQDIIDEDNLTVPHPEIYKRRFVLEPLCEIASFYIHPAFGISIRGLKDRLNDEKIVELYNGGDFAGR
jgi:2-amino-4-hydroxy-6-hydroxymethyldihydropteridine diphosphokinase